MNPRTIDMYLNTYTSEIHRYLARCKDSVKYKIKNESKIEKKYHKSKILSKLKSCFLLTIFV